MNGAIRIHWESVMCQKYRHEMPNPSLSSKLGFLT